MGMKVAMQNNVSRMRDRVQIWKATHVVEKPFQNQSWTYSVNQRAAKILHDNLDRSFKGVDQSDQRLPNPNISNPSDMKLSLSEFSEKLLPLRNDHNESG